jgi:hypothetical protein
MHVLPLDQCLALVVPFCFSVKKFRDSNALFFSVGDNVVMWTGLKQYLPCSCFISFTTDCLPSSPYSFIPFFKAVCYSIVFPCLIFVVFILSLNCHTIVANTIASVLLHSSITDVLAI